MNFLKIDPKATLSPALAPDIHPFFLNLQNQTEISALLNVLLHRSRAFLPPIYTGVQLTYHCGILFEQVTVNHGQVTNRPMTEFNFSTTGKDFSAYISDHKLVFFAQNNTSMLQLEFMFGASAQPESDDFSQTRLLLPQLVQLFFNQLFFLVKIKNYEFHSIKDDITMAYNQNYLKAFVHNEIERSKRYATMFSLIFFDLDNLKAINEIHGHLVGTEVLKEVAGILRSQVRKVDLLSRFGGDEFVIVLLHAGPDKAYEVSERIREKVNNHTFMSHDSLNVKITGCFGISSFPENGGTVEDLIRKSDMAMYEVKRKGKNGIKIYSEKTEEELEQ